MIQNINPLQYLVHSGFNAVSTAQEIIRGIDFEQIEYRYDEPATIRGVKPYFIDRENAERLWKLSEEMLGFKFDTE